MVPSPASTRRLTLTVAAGAGVATLLALGVGAGAGPLLGVVTGVTAALLVGLLASRVSGQALADASARAERGERIVAQAQSQLASAQHLATFGALGAGITHEVKNPVTALVGFAQLAQKRIDERDKVLEILRIIEAEGLRCRDLLTSYLEVARGSHGSRDLLDVNALVEQTARVTRHQLVVHHVELEIALGGALPPVEANRGELQQVLVNLLLNAQQAIRGQGKVRVSTSAAGGSVCITVADDGPGVPPELGERIFEPFFTTKLDGGGTGLGLSVSADIARAHGGTLRLDPTAGRGASFTLSLPAAQGVVTSASKAAPRAGAARAGDAVGASSEAASRAEAARTGDAAGAKAAKAKKGKRRSPGAAVARRKRGR